MFSKLENGAPVPFQSFSPYYVASTSQTHAPPQVSASEPPPPPPQARVQPPSQTPSAPPTRALISTVQQTSQFWKTENGTQSLSPHFVASSTSQTHAPPQPRVQALSQIPSTPRTRAVEILMHKSDLNVYCQKLRIPLPVYETQTIGFAYNLRFSSTVYIGERWFVSQYTFANKKSAEQDVAKLALECLLTEDEAWSKRHRMDIRKLVSRDLTRCKMILHEFAVKIKAQCTYKTVNVKEAPHVFVSYVKVNGTYKNEGGMGKNKKEAEQEAALEAILSFLNDPAYGTTICELIVSKLNCGAAFYEDENEEKASKRSRVW